MSDQVPYFSQVNVGTQTAGNVPINFQNQISSYSSLHQNGPSSIRHQSQNKSTASTGRFHSSERLVNSTDFDNQFKLVQEQYGLVVRVRSQSETNTGSQIQSRPATSTTRPYSQLDYKPSHNQNTSTSGTGAQLHPSTSGNSTAIVAAGPARLISSSTGVFRHDVLDTFSSQYNDSSAGLFDRWTSRESPLSSSIEQFVDQVSGLKHMVVKYEYVSSDSNPLLSAPSPPVRPHPAAKIYYTGRDDIISTIPATVSLPNQYTFHMQNNNNIYPSSGRPSPPNTHISNSDNNQKTEVIPSTRQESQIPAGSSKSFDSIIQQYSNPSVPLRQALQENKVSIESNESRVLTNFDKYVTHFESKTQQKPKETKDKDVDFLPLFEIKLEGVGVYRGELSNGTMSGKGQLLDLDNFLLYEGWFDDNQFEGVGILYNKRPETFPTVSVPSKDLSLLEKCVKTYEGQFSRSLYEGIGQLKYDSGAEFFGEFKKGKADGFGIWSDSKGKFAGLWSQNQLQVRFD